MKRRDIGVGTVIESLEVLEDLGLRDYGKIRNTFYRCRCTKCGNVIDVPMKNLGTVQKDCGCWRNGPRLNIKIGDTFGRLTVIDFGGKDKKGTYTYVCRCSCEKQSIVTVTGSRLKTGETKSCGCIHDELLRKNVKKYYKNNFVGGTSASKLLDDKLQKNNTSGCRNVRWHKASGKWNVSISYKGDRYYLGYFEDLEVAKEVAKEARSHILSDFESWYSQQYPEQFEKLMEKRNKKETP